MTTATHPTPLRWCASCDRYVRGDFAQHLDFHTGLTVEQARAPEAQKSWRHNIGMNAA